MRSSESGPGRTRPTGPRDAAAAAEERLEHVAEPAETGGEPAAGVPRRALHRVAAEVDDAPLLRIAEHLVGDADLVELRLAARRG